MSGCAGHEHAPRADREGERRPAAAALAAPYAVEPTDESERRTRIERLRGMFAERIVLLDGAMGTMIQQHQLDERGFRGERLRSHGRDLAGNNDILTLTRPEITGGLQPIWVSNSRHVGKEEEPGLALP